MKAQYINADALRKMFDPEPCRNTLRNWVKAGDLPKPRKIGNFNWWSLAAIEAHMQGNAGGLAGGLEGNENANSHKNKGV